MSTTFDAVKDSGQRQDFETGARRDTQDDKPRYGLIPPYPLRRLAMHYTNGAKKYGENNWTKGMPMSRTWESLERHVQAYKEGDASEDHLAAVAWNAFALMWYAEYMPEQNDLAEYLCWPKTNQVEDDPEHIGALGYLSSVLADRADAWNGNAPEWFPEPIEWLDLWRDALAKTSEEVASDGP